MNSTKPRQAKKSPAKKSPSEPKVERQEAFDTLKSAAAILELPLAILKLAKDRGCKAFRHGRVYRTPLLEWLKANPIEPPESSGDLATMDKAEVELEKARAQCRMFIAKADAMERVVIPKDEAKAEYARAFGIIEEEAKSLMEPDHYRIFIDRCKSRIVEVLPD